MGAVKRIPTGLLLDDDLEFLKLAKAKFDKFGINLEITQTKESFLKKSASSGIDFFLIDLNLDEALEGLTILEQMKKDPKITQPMFVISANSGMDVITHALNLGADDYFVKPLDYDLIAVKLSQFIKSDQLEEIRLPVFNTPGKYEECHLFYNISVKAVDEFGVFFESKDLITQGSSFMAESDFFLQFTEAKKIRLNIEKATPRVATQDFEYYAEFDNPTDSFLEKLRRWMSQKILGN